MTIDQQIDEQVDQLIFLALQSFDQAEMYLSDRYATAKAEGDHENLEYVLQKLAFLYGVKRDFDSADNAYAKWESESHDPTLARVETAFFLFNSANNFKRALEKAQEVEGAIKPKLKEQVASPFEVRSLFRALNIKGRSLLKLGRTKEVNNVVKLINNLVERNPHIQFGFELDLVEECLNAGLALNECDTYLQQAHWSSYDSTVFEPRKEEALKRLNALRR
jgi:hypothetical protein